MDPAVGKTIFFSNRIVNCRTRASDVDFRCFVGAFFCGFTDHFKQVGIGLDEARTAVSSYPPVFLLQHMFSGFGFDACYDRGITVYLFLAKMFSERRGFLNPKSFGKKKVIGHFLFAHGSRCVRT